MSDTRRFVVTVNARRLGANWKQSFAAHIRQAARRMSAGGNVRVAPDVKVIEVQRPGRGTGTGVDLKALAKARIAVARLKNGRARVLSDAEQRAHIRARQASSRRIAAVLKGPRSR